MAIATSVREREQLEAGESGYAFERGHPLPETVRRAYDDADLSRAIQAYKFFYYGELAALGIEKGKPFNPDARMRRILEYAARTANAQMRVQSFADRRPDRTVWKDRQWQWASLRFEDGDFNAATHVDLEAREKWFYQAVGASPAMFRRDPQAGSLYWLGLRDNTGAMLEGGKSYKLTVPLPVPGKLFWSVTVYDIDTRSQIQTTQKKAALRRRRSTEAGDREISRGCDSILLLRQSHVGHRFPRESVEPVRPQLLDQT